MVAGDLRSAQVWATFGLGTDHTAPFEINGVTGSLTSVNGPTATSFTHLHDPADLFGVNNFPNSYYTPTPPSHLQWAVLDVDRYGGSADDAVATYTLTFDTPILNPTFHFVNLDAAQVIFAGATGSDGASISGADLGGSFQRLSGNNVFDTGYMNFHGSTVFVANIVTQDAINSGLQGTDGSNPGGAGGSILLAGSYRSLSWVETEANPVYGIGDGHQFQISIITPEPASGSMLALGICFVFGWAGCHRFLNGGKLS